MEPGDLLAFVSTEMNRTTVTLALLVVFLVLLYWYSTSAFSKLSKVGIRHPPPLPFIGNLLFFHEGFWENHTKLITEYGPVCGKKALSERSQTQAYEAFDAPVTAALWHLCSALRTKCCKK